jgi:hypothetical protein
LKILKTNRRLYIIECSLFPILFQFFSQQCIARKYSSLNRVSMRGVLSKITNFCVFQWVFKNRNIIFFILLRNSILCNFSFTCMREGRVVLLWCLFYLFKNCFLMVMEINRVIIFESFRHFIGVLIHHFLFFFPNFVSPHVSAINMKIIEFVDSSIQDLS